MNGIPSIETDVLVCGGGPAGIGAAVAAAREGARVILAEKAEHLGGMMTGGLVLGFHGMRVHRNRHSTNAYQYVNWYEQQVIRGVAQDLFDHIVAQGGALGESGRSTNCVLIDPEITKVVIDEYCRTAGVDIWFQSSVTEPVVENGSIQTVRVENKSGSHLIHAEQFVDATGDADVAARSGVPFQFGDEKGGVQPVSLVFIMGGADLTKTIAYLKADPAELQSGDIVEWEKMLAAGKPVLLIGFFKKIYEAFSKGEYPLAMRASNPVPFFAISSMFRSGRVVNHETFQIADMAYKVDSTKGKDVSEALVHTRKQAIHLSNFMRKYIPGYENSYLIQSASQLGVRESRRIEGLYTLTSSDVLNGQDFHDTIARCGRAMNVHSTGGGESGERHGGRKWTEIKDGRSYGIPFRCLVPRQGPTNLLVAGRSISVDKQALGSVRGQPACMAIGQAAGTAAALAVKQSIAPADLKVADLQARLRENDVII